MTQRDYLNAVAKFFGNARPKTADGIGYRNEFIGWFKALTWLDKLPFNIDGTLQEALYYKTQYQLAERAAIIDERIQVSGDGDWSPGKYKTPGTQVPKPAGYHRAMPHEVTKPVLTFANQVLEVANPKPRLPQSHIIGKRIPGVVEGSPLLAQIEWHFDNHPARPDQGLGPMEGDPFYHMGVSLYMPDVTDQVTGDSRLQAPDSGLGRLGTPAGVWAPGSRKKNQMNNFLRDYIGDEYAAIAPPPPPRLSSRAPGFGLQAPRAPVRPPPSPLQSRFLPRAPLPLGPEHRSAFSHPFHHTLGHPDDWRTRGPDSDSDYRRMQRHAQMLALHHPSSITPENSYAPSYAPMSSPMAPSIRSMSDSISDSLPDSTSLPIFLPPQDDGTDLSLDSEINDEDLSNPGDSESDVQIAADFGAAKRRSGTRAPRTPGSRPQAPRAPRASGLASLGLGSSLGSSGSGLGSHSGHHHHKHQQDQQQQQQDSGGGGSSGGAQASDSGPQQDGGSNGGGNDGGNGGGYSDDDSDNFEGELAGSRGFDSGILIAGFGASRFG